MNIFRRTIAQNSRALAHAILLAGIVLTPCLVPSKLSAQTDLPANIDNGLRRFIAPEQQNRSVVGAKQPSARRSSFERSVIRDGEQRVLVEIHLNGKEPIAAVRSQLTDLGANVISETSSYRDGAFSAFVPANRIADVARLPGVLSMSLSHRPRKNVGATTSGGVFQQHTDMLNAQGLDGTGETIGVLSDSYNTATKDLFGDPLTIHEAQDIASGDLPGSGNPANTNPVVVIEDFNDPDAVDEGRAMLQIVFDVAPKAKLAFATGFISKIDFADNIRKLRTNANCNVIVDDITYTEEPMFSDGLIAQAVDDVVKSSILAGRKCVYLSSASNYQGGGYLSDFNPIADATARAGLPNQNLKLDQVPGPLTSGGFHNFNTDPAGPVDISQTFLIVAGSKVEFSFQWNDPFDQTPAPPDRPGVTTDYNILVFDADGNYLSAVSGTADNFSTQEALENIFVENAGATDAKYQIAITRAGTTPIVPVARKIRYLALDENGGIGAEEYYQPLAPSSHGHNCANGAISVAGYVYDDDPTDPVAPPFTPFIEDFSSPGPAVIYFDATGKRLTVPENRMKPEIAGPDGGNTTFFGDDYEGDGFPNFFGTSAAAPHAAAISALLLQKAGGPGSLSVAQLRNILEHSVTMEHDLDPFVSQTTLMPLGRRHATKRFTGATITLTGTGNSSNASSHDPNFFTLTFNSRKKKESLLAISIDLTNAGLKFDTTTISTGFPLTLGRMVGITAADITIGAPTEVESVSTIVLAFRPGAFKNGTSLSFGIDRDFIGDAGGNTGDYIEGGEVDAFTTVTSLRGFFQNTYGFGFTIADGFGLIDAVQAAQMVTPGPVQ